jgi:subtilisin family serine protease
VYDEGNIAGFSSDGPTADGRLKPEVLARGVDTVSVSVSDPNAYDWVSGTSLSTPLVASVAACLVQARPEWTVDALRGRLFYSASDFVQNRQADPSFIRGYGILDAYAALTFVDCDGDGVDDLSDIESGTYSDVNGNSVPDGCEHVGDVNCDDGVDFDDIDGFVLAITNRDEYEQAFPGCDFNRADIDGDFDVNFNDIDPFVELLIR